MEEVFGSITLLGGIIFIIMFGIAIYINIWVYYSADKKKFPLFPIVSPFSLSSYELMMKSMFKLSWEAEGPNKELKLRSNQLRKLSGLILLLTLIFGILTAIAG